MIIIIVIIIVVQFLSSPSSLLIETAMRFGNVSFIASEMVFKFWKWYSSAWNHFKI